MGLSSAEIQSRNLFVWSCRYFPGIRSAYRPSKGIVAELAVCLYCNKEMLAIVDDWTDRLIHLHSRHQYRACTQDLYTSLVDFEKHLRISHFFTTQAPVSNPVIFISPDQEKSGAVTTQNTQLQQFGGL
jgi:hypothetical protein